MKGGFRPWMRKALIAFATLFFGSALLTPQLNPVTSGWLVPSPSTAAVIGNGWSEVQALRMYIAADVSDTGVWPADLGKYGVPLHGQVFDFSSPAPFELVATVRSDLRDGKELRGTGVVFRLDSKKLLWSCARGTPPLPSPWLPESCREATEAEPLVEGARWMVVIIVTCVLILVALALLLVLRHPLLAPIQREPLRLLRQPVGVLARIDRAMRLVRRRADTLAAARVQEADWREAVGFAQALPDARAATLALRVGARSERAEGWSLPGDVYEWRFPLELPVTLERCVVWLPRADIDGVQAVRHWRQVQTGLDVMLVFPAGEGDLGALRDFCLDRSNLCVLIGPEAQTAWLLERDAVRVLLHQLAQQLKVTRISPYQTRGGVARPSSFFGREAQLARVILREPANYLLVGGRQLGKTSLMKAIERRLRDHPQLACLYVSLRDHRLAPRLAAQCGLPVETGLDEIVAHLARVHGGKRLLLLIDEADPFFRHDAAQDHRELASLRAISEEGRCHFLLAGFWDLYAAAALDYQSPLRNFGDVITVGALEAEACRDLATVPLALLNLRFADPALVERLVVASGRRANLVAILCQECLEVLDSGETVIEAPHLERASRSQAVLDAIAGWGRLSQDEAASRLDRIVVYRVAALGETTLADIVELLETAGLAADVEALRRAFARLQLAFVLARSEERYHFAVPLFSSQFQAAELPVYLRQELKALQTRVSD